MPAKPKNGTSARKVKSFRLDELTLARIDYYRVTKSAGEPMSESDAVIRMLERYPASSEPTKTP